jgi:hypothetical protein
MKKILLPLLLFTTACATGSIGRAYQQASQNYSVEFPEKWGKVNTSKYLILTKDGPFKQYIMVQQRAVDQPFRHTKRKLNRQMLPEEAASVVIDEILSDRVIRNLKVISNTPAMVNHYDGFRVVFTYKNEKGTEFKTLYYGFLRGEWFYSLRYNADQNHYSNEGVSAFMKLLHSFQINGSTSA